MTSQLTRAMPRKSMFDIRMERLMTTAEAASIGGGAFGRITIGDFSELFSMSLGFWSPEDYRNHWIAALVHLDAASDVTSCLISSVTHPSQSNFVFCWPLYRDGDAVLVQNRILFLDELESPLDLARPWSVLKARESISEDGDAISEWLTTIDEIRDYQRRQSIPMP